MKKIIFILCLFFSLSASAQSADTVRILPKNAIYFELLGNGILGSINYERMFRQKGTWRIAGRIGLGGYPAILNRPSPWHVIVPTELLFLKGRKNRFLELGVGLTTGLVWYTENINSTEYHEQFVAVPMLRIGYRYQSKNGFVFRAGLLGIFGFNPNRKIAAAPWLGFSFGKSF